MRPWNHFVGGWIIFSVEFNASSLEEAIGLKVGLVGERERERDLSGLGFVRFGQ